MEELSLTAVGPQAAVGDRAFPVSRPHRGGCGTGKGLWVGSDMGSRIWKKIKFLLDTCLLFERGIGVLALVSFDSYFYMYGFVYDSAVPERPPCIAEVSKDALIISLNDSGGCS